MSAALSHLAIWKTSDWPGVRAHLAGCCWCMAQAGDDDTGERAEWRRNTGEGLAQLVDAAIIALDTDIGRPPFPNPCTATSLACATRLRGLLEVLHERQQLRYVAGIKSVAHTLPVLCASMRSGSANCTPCPLLFRELLRSLTLVHLYTTFPLQTTLKDALEVLPREPVTLTLLCVCKALDVATMRGFLGLVEPQPQAKGKAPAPPRSALPGDKALWVAMCQAALPEECRQLLVKQFSTATKFVALLEHLGDDDGSVAATILDNYSGILRPMLKPPLFVHRLHTPLLDHFIDLVDHHVDSIPLLLPQTGMIGPAAGATLPRGHWDPTRVNRLRLALAERTPQPYDALGTLVTMALVEEVHASLEQRWSDVDLDVVRASESSLRRLAVSCARMAMGAPKSAHAWIPALSAFCAAHVEGGTPSQSCGDVAASCTDSQMVVERGVRDLEHALHTVHDMASPSRGSCGSPTAVKPGKSSGKKSKMTTPVQPSSKKKGGALAAPAPSPPGPSLLPDPCITAVQLCGLTRRLLQWTPAATWPMSSRCKSVEALAKVLVWWSSVTATALGSGGMSALRPPRADVWRSFVGVVLELTHPAVGEPGVAAAEAVDTDVAAIDSLLESKVLLDAFVYTTRSTSGLSWIAAYACLLQCIHSTHGELWHDVATGKPLTLPSSSLRLIIDTVGRSAGALTHEQQDGLNTFLSLLDSAQLRAVVKDTVTDLVRHEWSGEHVDPAALGRGASTVGPGSDASGGVQLPGALQAWVTIASATATREPSRGALPGCASGGASWGTALVAQQMSQWYGEQLAELLRDYRSQTDERGRRVRAQLELNLALAEKHKQHVGEELAKQRERDAKRAEIGQMLEAAKQESARRVEVEELAKRKRAEERRRVAAELAAVARKERAEQLRASMALYRARSAALVDVQRLLGLAGIPSSRIMHVTSTLQSRTTTVVSMNEVLEYVVTGKLEVPSDLAGESNEAQENVGATAHSRKWFSDGETVSFWAAVMKEVGSDVLTDDGINNEAPYPGPSSDGDAPCGIVQADGSLSGAAPCSFHRRVSIVLNLFDYYAPGVTAGQLPATLPTVSIAKAARLVPKDDLRKRHFQSVRDAFMLCQQKRLVEHCVDTVTLTPLGYLYHEPFCVVDESLRARLEQRQQQLRHRLAVTGRTAADAVSGAEEEEEEAGVEVWEEISDDEEDDGDDPVLDSDRVHFLDEIL